AICEEAASQLSELYAAGHLNHGWSDHAPLARELLGDDPVKIVDALKAAIRIGPPPLTSADRLPMQRRSGWLASAMPTSTPTGNGSSRIHLRQCRRPDVQADRERRHQQ